MDPKINAKTKGAEIKRIGHTFSGLHGNDPHAQRRGYPKEPTPATFGKGS